MNKVCKLLVDGKTIGTHLRDGTKSVFLLPRPSFFSASKSKWKNIEIIEFEMFGNRSNVIARFDIFRSSRNVSNNFLNISLLSVYPPQIETRTALRTG